MIRMVRALGVTAAVVASCLGNQAVAQNKTIDAVLGRLGSGQCAGRTVEGLHDEDRHRHEIRIRAVAELRRPHAQRAEFRRQALRPAHRRLASGSAAPPRTATMSSSTTSSPRKASRWPTSRRRRSMAIRTGRRARRTTGRCRRWAMPMAGPIARTGSREPEIQAEFKEKYDRDLAPPKTWDELKRSPNSSRAARSTARRSMAPRSSPSAARKASPWASPTALYSFGFKYENPEQAL